MFKETLCVVSMFMGYSMCSDAKALELKRASGDGIVIHQAYAGVDDGKTCISGSVERSFAPGYSSASFAHLDITATRNGKTVRAVSTEFFPRAIPETRQGVKGRSRFAVTLGELPPDTQIAVAVHRQSIRDCPLGAGR